MGWTDLRSRFDEDLKPLIYFWRFMGLLFTGNDNDVDNSINNGRPITLTTEFSMEIVNESNEQENKNKLITNISAFQVIYAFVLSLTLLMYLDFYGMDQDDSISHLKEWLRFVVPINFISLLIINTYVNDIIKHFDNVNYWVFMKNNANTTQSKTSSKKKPALIIFLYIFGIYWMLSPFKRMLFIYLSVKKLTLYRDVIHTFILARLFYPYKFIITLFIYFSWQLYKELEDIHELLSNFKNDGNLMKYFTKTPSALMLEKIRMTHRKHFCICQKMNGTFGFILLQLYLNLFVEVFNSLFELTYTQNGYVKCDSIGTLMTYMIGIYFTSYYSEKIINLESRMETELLTIKLDNFSQDFLQQVELYITQIRTCPIRLTAMNFVNIDKYWVSFLTSIVKLTILIIQFPSVLRSLEKKYNFEY